MTPADLAGRATHPRLAVLVAGGLALLALGGALAVSGAYLGAGTRILGLRVGFVGAVLFVFGASGYVALAVFESHPEHRSP